MSDITEIGPGADYEHYRDAKFIGDKPFVLELYEALINLKAEFKDFDDMPAYNSSALVALRHGGEWKQFHVGMKGPNTLTIKEMATALAHRIVNECGNKIEFGMLFIPRNGTILSEMARIGSKIIVRYVRDYLSRTDQEIERWDVLVKCAIKQS